MSLRDLVLEGIASGALDAAAIDRWYDASVEQTKRWIAEEFANDGRPRGLKLMARMCKHQWPLQPCEVGK